MLKEYIKLIKCYIYKLDPLDYTYKEVKTKIKEIKHQKLCDKYHVSKDTVFTHKLKRKLNKEYKKNLVKVKHEFKTKPNVLKHLITKLKNSKKLKDLEPIIYVLLGVEYFKTLTLKLEDLLTNKKQYKGNKYDLINGVFNIKNWNYHISKKNRLDSLIDAKMNLLHNGEIHTKWLLTITLINVILLSLSSLTLIPFLVFKIHALTWLLKNVIDLYCIMLQRYNWIKLTNTINEIVKDKQKTDTNFKIDQSFKTLYKNLKPYRKQQMENYKKTKEEFIKKDVETKQNNLIKLLIDEGMEGIINYTKAHPEDKELVINILNNKLYGVEPVKNKDIFEVIKQYNQDKKIISKDVLIDLYKRIIKDNNQQFVCSNLQFKWSKTKCASFNKMSHTISYYHNNTISNAKKYYKDFIKCYKVDIEEHEFINMYLIWVLLHELDHVDKTYKINIHGNNYKLYKRVYRLDKYYKLVFKEDELVSERIANTNATVNINKMINNEIFSNNLTLFCNHQFNNIINNGYHFDKLIKCPIDKYFIKTDEKNTYVKKLYGYKLTKQQYKDI